MAILMVPPAKAIAKLSRPQTEHVLSRDRLFARLDQAVSCPIIWMSAPGGAGKTILASSYIARHQRSHLWYQLDGSDTDPATFFYFLGQAGNNLSPQRRKLPLLTPEFTPGLMTFSRNFFAELYRRLKPPALIVLDDYHQLGAEAPLHHILLAALDRIPLEIKFLILSRQEPPPAFARLKVCRHLNVLTWSDLRLTPLECAGIMDLEKKEEAPAQSEIERIHKLSGGWAAGVRLLLDAKERESGYSGGFATGGHEAVFDYFASEIFSGTPEHVRDFLLRTSHFPQMTGPMAQQLTGASQADGILQNLVRRNHFTERRTSLGLYRYHPLFRAFLQNLAEKLFGAEELAGCRRKAAGILLAEGMAKEAAALSIQAGDWPGLIQIIMRQAPVLIQEGRNQCLEQWISALPGEILANTPWIQFWLGVSRLHFDQAASREWLSRAYARFKEQGDGAGAYLAWAAVIEGYIHEWDQISPLDGWIAEMDELRHRFPDYGSPEVEMRVTGSMFAALIYRQPDHPAFEQWRQQAERLALSAADLPLRLLTGCNLFLHYLWTGNLARQGFILTALRHAPLQENQPAHVPYLIMLHCLELFHSIFIGATKEEVLKQNARIEKLANESGFHLFDHKLPFGKCYYYLLAGEYAPLRALLDELAVSLERRSLEKNHLYLLQAWHAWTVLGDSGLALEFLDISLREAEKTGFWYFAAFCHAGFGHLYTELGDYEQASFHLAQLKHCSEKYRNDLIDYHYLVFSANLAFARAEEGQGLALLRQTLALAREKGLLATMSWWQPEMMADLCCKALEAGIEPDYVRHLIRKCHLRPASPPVEIECWPWPFRIYTLGRFEIIKDEQPLQFCSRAQQKPVMLLKMLIALGGRRVHEGRLAELLWPEVDGDLQHQNFRTTLHRLRKILESPEAVFYQEGNLSLDPRLFWVDVWAFARLAGKAANKGPASPQTADLHLKAIALYKGPFMALEENVSSYYRQRDHLHELFLKTIGNLATFHHQEGRRREAIDLYWRGLSIDSLVEPFYREIMTCHLEAGDHAEAARVHECCRKQLVRIGIEPSPATTLLLARSSS
jgi:LuxR family transcriptional regulator, maltose regulon positive regulatory protein